MELVYLAHLWRLHACRTNHLQPGLPHIQVGQLIISPIKISHACSKKLLPEATTPHENAHMGGNQVIGLSNSPTSLAYIVAIVVFST